MAEDIPLAVRKMVYSRDHFKCRWCGRSNGVSIHLHHVVYRSGGGKHVPENLISLCNADHALAHSDKNVFQPLLLELLASEPNVTGLQLVRRKQRDVSQVEHLRRLRDFPPGDRKPGSGTSSMRAASKTGPVERFFPVPEQ